MQGVGFRPFVYRLAVDLGLTGSVVNDGDGVWCEVQGSAEVLRRFAVRLQNEAPPLATITSVEVSDLDPRPIGQGPKFSVELSPTGDATGPTEPALIPPDISPCSSCLAEIADQDDRRYRYPFTCCTDCGPRFTVVDGLPYERAATSLASFALCSACTAEYEEPDDRRFHAQATCCSDCGPQLEFIAKGGESSHGEAAMRAAAKLIGGGGIVALKGLGGYQLVCRADDSVAVQRLRDRKQRDEKPFAVLVGDLESAHEFAQLDTRDEQSLAAIEAPILLVQAKPATQLAPEVAPNSNVIGLMLAASPIHAILVSDVGTPLVCTSGNLSGAPIIIDDAEALELLAPICDGWLTHNRRIVRRADDSVGQIVADRFQLLRRARGFAPRAVTLVDDGPAVLGVGAELKNTICLASGRHATLSVHLGDLEHPTTLGAFESAISDQLSLRQQSPELVVHDLHPEYLSTKFANAQDLAPTLAVQHHHAHLVSCLVDNQFAGPAIGVTFDGMGWGTDASAWGGEFLVGDAAGFHRAAHLGTVALPGGAMAIREPWRMAVSYLANAFGPDLPELPLLDRFEDLEVMVALCASATTMQTSSIGRLFDAVASLCGVADAVSYEGQAAIGLEQLAAKDQSAYLWSTAADGAIDSGPLIRAVVDDLVNAVSPSVIAGRFHTTLAVMVTATCRRIRSETGLQSVALSGGVFQNRLLAELVVPLLEAERFQVLRHSQVPPNDGGISLGQVAIGRAHLRNL